MPVAVFWDQSLVWGLICVETLDLLGIPFHLLGADDIGRRALERYRVLVVPGGWASHKMRALGEAGREEIGRFVERGGGYIGFCGGAGLALSSPPALGLVSLERMPLQERLPSASGGVWVRGIPNHPAWRDLPSTIPSSVWFPSQFAWKASEGLLCLATYASLGDGFYVADLPAADFTALSIPWDEWEKAYGINLNPERMLGHPAIIEARRGKGRLVLSYPHLETPGDAWGNRLFAHLVEYLDHEASVHLHDARHGPDRYRGASLPLGGGDPPPGPEAIRPLARMAEAAEDLIAFGERHLLWHWRQPWLLNWRRGIRGLEYGTLCVVLRAMLRLAREAKSRGGWGGEACASWSEKMRGLEDEVYAFCALAKRLLLEEKLAIQNGGLTKLGRVNERVDRLRGELFAGKMNHGGLCSRIFDRLDGLLLDLLRLRAASALRSGALSVSSDISDTSSE